MDVWSVVGVAAAVASAVAAIVSTCLVLWLRYRDRPAAEWMVEPLYFVQSPAFDRIWRQVRSGPPHEQIVVTNVGDGTAYRLRAEGVGCKVLLYRADASDSRGFATPSSISHLRTGEHFGLFIWHDKPSLREAERVKLLWRESPTRHRTERECSLDYVAEVKAQQDAFDRDHKLPTTASRLEKR